MSFFGLFFVFLQICLIQSVYSQCWRGTEVVNNGLGYGAGLAGLGGNIIYERPCLGGIDATETESKDDTAKPVEGPSVKLTAISGGYGGSGIGNLGIFGQLPVFGRTLIAGSLPARGAVEFGGCVPAGGIVKITGNCACGCNQVISC